MSKLFVEEKSETFQQIKKQTTFVVIGVLRVNKRLFIAMVNNFYSFSRIQYTRYNNISRHVNEKDLTVRLV